ncbi:hypothetical protein VTP01DRAFT_2391 [Rhizomucor pusillus]|uniref:uncharacterized protein n=1 Tax=Rhizomucor pusillus TaxID=4840 RepID=UPI003743B0E2
MDHKSEDMDTLNIYPIDVLSWDEAYAKADKLVSQLTLDQIVSISQGKGLLLGKCTGVSGSTTDPDLPGLCLSDGPLGVRASPYASVFPAGINAAASFDKEAIHQRGLDMGAEFRGKGANVQLGPAMNIARVPNAGRNWEGSEELIECRNKIAAAKHFITNDQETNRMLHSTEVDDRTLHEIYLWPFARSVEAGAGTIMCSYNKINGTYACENDHTLNQILKGELGFRGFVQVTGWPPIPPRKQPGGFLYFGSALKRAVKHGHVDIKRVEDMTRRIVATWYKLVLLRNQKNTLPIQPSVVKTIAVIGEDAQRDPNRKNNTSCSPLSKYDDGTLIQGGGSGSSNIPYVIAKSSIQVTSHLKNGQVDKAASIAKDADVAIVFAHKYAAESSDLSNLDLDDDANKLVRHS